MHLFIGACNIKMEIPNIILKEGYLPSVGDLDIRSPEILRQARKMEPAPWFKVQVLDSISIDCSRRAIMWNCDSALPPLRESTVDEEDNEDNEDSVSLASSRLSDRLSSVSATDEVDRTSAMPNTSKKRPLNRESRKRKRISDSMYIGGEWYAQESDLDELFSTIEKIVKDYEALQLSLEDMNEKVLQLLNRHVLPAITLSKEDLPQVQKVFKEQCENIQRFDQKLLDKNAKVEEVLNALKRHRQQFIQQIIKMKEEVQQYPLDFAQSLQQDIDEDIQEATDELDLLQNNLELAKQTGEEENDISKKDLIAMRRSSRDLCLTNQMQLLLARENLKEIISSISSKAKTEKSASPRFGFRRNSPQKMNPLHAIYIAMHEKVQDIRNEGVELVDRKVLMISVKEAIKSALEDLKSGEDSSGIQANRQGSHRATDVLAPSQVPREWQTLGEQIANILDDTNHAIAKQHYAFCSTVIEKCNAISFQETLLNAKMNGHPEDEAFDESIRSEDNLTRSDSWHDPSPPSKLATTPSSDEMLDSGIASRSISEISETDNNITTHQCTNLNSIVETECVFGDENVVFVHDLENSYLGKATIDELKVSIRDHCDDITREIQYDLGYDTPNSFNNIWLKYEAHLYDIIMEHLLKLYKTAYSGSLANLKSSLEHLTIGDLELKDSVAAGMLQFDTPLLLSPCSEEGFDESSFSPHQDENSNKSKLGSMKRVQLNYPTPVTVIYNRTTWPRNNCLEEDIELQYKSLEEGNELSDMCLEESKKNSSKQSSELRNEQSIDDLLNSVDDCHRRERYDSESTFASTVRPRSLTLQTQYRQQLDVAIQCIHATLQDDIPLQKMQHLSQCLREINTVVTNYQQKVLHTSAGACADDLIDMLIITLCNCDVSDTSNLYPHLMLLADMMPPFFENGHYSFSLVQFIAAFQFLQDRMLLKQNPQPVVN